MPNKMRKRIAVGGLYSLAEWFWLSRLECLPAASRLLTSIFPTYFHYTITTVQDPYGCALTTDSPGGADSFRLSPVVINDNSRFLECGHV